MAESDPDTEALLQQAADGDCQARNVLLQVHRSRLRCMVALRLSPLLAARVDPSDIVQDTLLEANRRLADYLHDRPLPFYPWLRRLAWDRLVDQYRQHVRAAKRSVRHERADLLDVSDQSVLVLADHLVSPGSTPSARLRRQEMHHWVRAALANLSEPDREVLLLRFLEELSAPEVAAVLEISEEAAKKRVLRALQRLRDLLNGDGKGTGT